MLHFISKLLIINPKNAYKIKNHIFKQSRKSNLYISYNIEDNFDNRLNFIVLHLSLVIIIINTQFKKKYIGYRLNKKIFKYFFEEIDFSLRENAYGDKTIEKKISDETLWNQLIYNKFFSKIKIDKEKIKKDIDLVKRKSKSYLLNEIVYSVDNNDEKKNLFEKIKKSIAQNGFENAAAIYSVAETSKTGGNLGWISENTINKDILKYISKLKIGEFTNPILIPSGFLILRVKDIKEIEKKIDIEKELNLRIRTMQNQQLNQYSNIYFKKIKKNILIDEK